MRTPVASVRRGRGRNLSVNLLQPNMTRIPLTLYLLMTLALTRTVHTAISGSFTDSEGSGDDLESSGGGDWSEEVSPKIKVPSSSGDAEESTANRGVGAKNTLHAQQGSPVLNSDHAAQPGKKSGSGVILLGSSKHFWERDYIFTGLVVGGIMGVILAIALATILILKRELKDNGGYILGQQTASDKSEMEEA